MVVKGDEWWLIMVNAMCCPLEIAFSWLKLQFHVWVYGIVITKVKDGVINQLT